MAGGGSKLAVFAAIGANSVVMTAKFIGFALTGSGSMLSEAIHSLADVGNQSLLAFGMRQSNKPDDETHPFGYGLEAFVWSLISAVGIFFVGCGLSLMHAFEAFWEYFMHHGESHYESPGMTAIGILIFALVIEGASLGVAVAGLLRDAKKQGYNLVQYVRKTEDPFGVAILAEDGAAVLGVVIALAAVLLAEYTGNPLWDAIGTLLIGLLLGWVAVFLISKNRGFLLGKAVSKEKQQIIANILSNDPAVDKIAVQRAVVRGTDRFRISAEIDLNGEYIANKWLEGQDLAALHAQLTDPESLRKFLGQYGETVLELTGDEIDRLENALREAMPKARDIALEPD